MAVSKAEGALYAGGIGALVGTLLFRKRLSKPRQTQTLILGGGLLLTAGAMSLHRRALPGGIIEGLRGHAPLGLANTENHDSQGARLKVWDDPNMTIKQRVHLLQGLVATSVKDPSVRNLALAVTGHGPRNVTLKGGDKLAVPGAACPARDDKCEAKAIFDWVANPKNVRYTGDTGAHALSPGGPVEAVDEFQTALRTLQYRGGDCLPAGTLLLVEGHRLVPIEDVLPGTKIWGLDRWSTVGDVWWKGELPIDAIQLNNGSWIKTTPDHKVYVAFCKSHPVAWADGTPCSCKMDNREIKRIPVSELTEKMVLVAPERVPFGDDDSLDPDRAYVEGLYAADGWRSHDSDFDIAGRDGRPKEAQKRAVQEICARLGVETTWFDKSIRIRDAEWARRVQRMGGHAPEKHLLSINLAEAQAAAVLRGIMADADERRVLTTTSRELMIQARLLHKMLGTTCGVSYIEDHGGLGRHPIWRLTARRSDGGWSSKGLLRVRSIERNVATVPVYDISTDDHYVYLPEADVTVSNCDDHAVLNAALAIKNGFPAKFRITSNSGDSWDHIYAMVGVPKLDPSEWIALDTTLGPGKFNKQPKRAKQIDFAA